MPGASWSGRANLQEINVMDTTELPETEVNRDPLSISTKELLEIANSGDKEHFAVLTAQFENGLRDPIVIRDNPFDLRPRGIPRKMAEAIPRSDAWVCLVVDRPVLPDVDLGWTDYDLAEDLCSRAGKRRLLVIFATDAGVDEWIAFLKFHNPDMPIAVVDGKDRGRIVCDGDLRPKE